VRNTPGSTASSHQLHTAAAVAAAPAAGRASSPVAVAGALHWRRQAVRGPGAGIGGAAAGGGRP
jgi:hypothetical protein